jgi:endonuclease III
METMERAYQSMREQDEKGKDIPNRMSAFTAPNRLKEIYGRVPKKVQTLTQIVKDLTEQVDDLEKRMVQQVPSDQEEDEGNNLPSLYNISPDANEQEIEEFQKSLRPFIKPIVEELTQHVPTIQKIQELTQHVPTIQKIQETVQEKMESLNEMAANIGFYRDELHKIWVAKNELEETYLRMEWVKDDLNSMSRRIDHFGRTVDLNREYVYRNIQEFSKKVYQLEHQMGSQPIVQQQEQDLGRPPVMFLDLDQEAKGKLEEWMNYIANHDNLLRDTITNYLQQSETRWVNEHKRFQEYMESTNQKLNMLSVKIDDVKRDLLDQIDDAIQPLKADLGRLIRITK